MTCETGIVPSMNTSVFNVTVSAVDGWVVLYWHSVLGQQLNEPLCRWCCENVFGVWPSLGTNAFRQIKASPASQLPSTGCCTFFACCVLGVQIPTHCHHLNKEPVASLADHVDHLSVSHLHHVLLVYLLHTHTDTQRHNQRTEKNWGLKPRLIFFFSLSKCRFVCSSNTLTLCKIHVDGRRMSFSHTSEHNPEQRVSWWMKKIAADNLIWIKGDVCDQTMPFTLDVCLCTHTPKLLSHACEPTSGAFNLITAGVI